MRSYLPDAGFCGFGVTAAWVLKDLWDQEQNSARDVTLFARSDFTDVKVRRMAREKAAGGDSSAYAEAILSVVSDLIKPGTDQEAHRHALALAAVAFLMPYGDKNALIDALLMLPEPLQEKQHLLKVLAVSGELVSADMVEAGIKELLEEAKTKSWLLDENSGRLDGWLELLPFSDRPKATLEVIVSLDPRLRVPWRLRRVLSALAHAPSPEAEEVLAQLARHDARFLGEHEWLNALDNRDTASAGRLLFKLVCDGAFSAGGRTDAWWLSKKLASSIQYHADLRKEVYEQYPTLPSGSGKAIVARAIGEAPDIDGIMLLVSDYAAQNKSFNETVLHEALRHLLTGQRPSSQWVGMEEVFNIPSPELRKKLFALVVDGGASSELSVACLSAIDNIREDYGEAESERRHPDITTGRPWPIITNWRES
jgi:NACHT C-terminal Alpha/Beta 2